MKRPLVTLTGITLVFLAAAATAQQASPTAPPRQAQDAKPDAAKPALKLRLNEIDERDRRSIVAAPPSNDDKRDASGALPGLGGKPSRSWDTRADDFLQRTDDRPY